MRPPAEISSCFRRRRRRRSDDPRLERFALGRRVNFQIRRPVGFEGLRVHGSSCPAVQAAPGSFFGKASFAVAMPTCVPCEREAAEGAGHRWVIMPLVA